MLVAEQTIHELFYIAGLKQNGVIDVDTHKLSRESPYSGDYRLGKCCQLKKFGRQDLLKSFVIIQMGKEEVRFFIYSYELTPLYRRPQLDICNSHSCYLIDQLLFRPPITDDYEFI